MRLGFSHLATGNMCVYPYSSRYFHKLGTRIDRYEASVSAWLINKKVGGGKSHQLAIRGMIEAAGHAKAAESCAHVIYTVRLTWALRVWTLCPVHTLLALHRHRPHGLCIAQSPNGRA